MLCLLSTCPCRCKPALRGTCAAVLRRCLPPREPVSLSMQMPTGRTWLLYIYQRACKVAQWCASENLAVLRQHCLCDDAHRKRRVSLLAQGTSVCLLSYRNLNPAYVCCVVHAQEQILVNVLVDISIKKALLVGGG